MSAPIPSRTQIEQAGELDFPARRPKPDILITIKCRMGGFDTELAFSGSVDQLPRLVERLAQLGAEPVSGIPRTGAPTVQAGAPLQRRASVVYDDDGTPLCGNANCSRHGKPLEPSQHSGYYCKGKDDKTGNSKGYCRSKAD